ncbi:hypothetical protein ACWGRK_13045 [Saccharomonospora azurea]|uniref:Uncharacterized protein n=1 Tax=Saccharomonospora azurea NA-128 TaxID=882081 RepID=H8G4F8_9PSEU|nr:hypothetical protein [Saccharomonospora azurea]EHY88107.1 hypothetical protein SacazDRAFT_01171 [Saccharomonospora azurea NA-128]
MDRAYTTDGPHDLGCKQGADLQKQSAQTIKARADVTDGTQIVAP